ncbi:hypothetical protein BGW42_004252 [Actinomortierella wolfii]|nr:hypothetical protein BGW42_004252 [Actinomortierella wolfii]
MSSPRVLIVGAGIGGLSLAIFLERAGIDYMVYERTETFKPLGSSIALSAQVLRAFDQLGMLQEMQKIGLPFVDARYHLQDLSLLGRVDPSRYEHKFGYNSIFFARPDLMKYFLSKIPAHKVQWNKRVLSIEQNKEGVMIRTSDGNTYHGDILIGSDGAYSAVRQSLFQLMESKGLHVPAADKEGLRFDQFAIVGVTKDLSDEIPELKRTDGTSMNIVLASNTQAFNVYTIPLPGGTIGWMVNGSILQSKMDDNESASFRFSEWGCESIDKLRKRIDDIKVVIGGTVKNLIDNTEHISQVMLEDKFVKTWYHGRTCLMGDAVHKVLPAGGQGGNQAILDAICLANLISEKQSSDPDDITAVFKRYYELRAGHAKNTVEGSKQLNKIMTTQIYGGRPQLSFVDPIPLKGCVKNKSPEMSFVDKKMDKMNSDSRLRSAAVV